MLPIVILTIEDESDRDFMTRIYLDYARLMYSEMRKISSNRGIMDDVLQDSLIRLMNKIDVLKEMDEAKRINYVITTVRNRMRNYCRDHKKDPTISLDDENCTYRYTLYAKDDAEEMIFRQERVERLHAIWPRLSVQTQQLLEEKYILEYSNEEIAKEFGVKPASVRMMLTRARKEVLAYFVDEG